MAMAASSAEPNDPNPYCRRVLPLRFVMLMRAWYDVFLAPLRF